MMPPGARNSRDFGAFGWQPVTMSAAAKTLVRKISFEVGAQLFRVIADSINESHARLCLSTLIHLIDLLVSAQIKYGALSGRPPEKMKKMNFLLEMAATII